ncbi:hypothetical protein J437_LFUL011487 [Ladona fulva]|uniref:DUF5641 domain-containing protein n=1 Tax=Ladona fulva TaxID=123851 RepID=A0A8K0KDD4_LADFU|nr:hypothetical protein J437_LFUL011487 [Ladona fulva]
MDRMCVPDAITVQNPHSAVCVFLIRSRTSGFVMRPIRSLLHSCTIEAALNSRPLTAKSSDPEEIDCLTPGHFLKYLHTLQQRSKWTRGIGDPKIGDLVLIRVSNLPTSLWKMGRIVQLFPEPPQVLLGS